jgi:plasmid stabilization system protein ParE
METPRESVSVHAPASGVDAEPGASSASEVESWEVSGRFRVIFNLVDGDWVEIGSFDAEDAAERCAQKLAAELAKGASWPRVGSRFLRPDTILSIEISERRRLTGSASRASYWKGSAEPEG